MDICLEDHVLRVIENNLRFAESFQEYRPGEGLLVRAGGKEVVIPAQILGTAHPHENTWRWAWSDETLSAPMLASARRIRELIPYPIFQQAQIALEDMGMADAIAITCVGALEQFAYFAIPRGEDWLYVTIETPPAYLAGFTRTAMSVSHLLIHAVNLLSFSHREALTAFLGSPESESPANAAWTVAGTRMSIDFDPHGRIAKINR